MPASPAQRGREKRPGFDRLLKDAIGRKANMIAAWSLDRFGRSLQDLIWFLTDLQALGRDVYLHQQALDTSTSSGRAMFQMCGDFAEFERGMIRERVNAGLARAKERGVKLGRRPVKVSVEARIRDLRAQGIGILKIGRTLGIGTSVVQRVLSAMRFLPTDINAHDTCSATKLPQRAETVDQPHVLDGIADHLKQSWARKYQRETLRS
ncbi:DNA invertase Pin-like site-specific DNA recombinase [Bradyrhizobium diazoefficiens]